MREVILQVGLMTHQGWMQDEVYYRLQDYLNGRQSEPFQVLLTSMHRSYEVNADLGDLGAMKLVERPMVTHVLSTAVVAMSVIQE